MKISVLRVSSSAPVVMSADTPLLCCPNELLLIIAENLDTKGLNSLLRTCRHLAALLTPLLRKIAIQDKEGTSALHWAAARGHGPLVTLVLENGAPINGQDTSEKTPLQCAVAAGHVEIVRLLLNHGADFHVREQWAYTALHCAAWSGDIKVLQELIQTGNGKRDVPESRDGELSPIILTAMNPRQQQAAVLLRGTISPTVFGGAGTLHQAMHRDYKEAVQLLRGNDNGVNNSAPRKGETPLDRAVKLRRLMRRK